MFNSLSAGRMLAAGFIVLAAALLTAPQAAHAKPGTPDVPPDLQVPSGSALFLVGHAVGVQVYGCTVTASGPTWTLVAPRADLYGDSGRLVATHFAGPAWEASDGSQVVGKRVAGVTVTPTAIPWLKLSAASTNAGAEGDRLVATTFVQRLNTVGGLAPAASQCDTTTVGALAEVPYTADYYFWR